MSDSFTWCLESSDNHPMEIQDLLCRSPMLLQWLNIAIHLHSSLWHSSTWVFLSSLHLQHTFTIGDGSVHFPYLTTSRFGTGWASIGFLSSKRWADLEVDPNSFSSCPRPNHAGLPGLPWGDTSVPCSFVVASALSFVMSRMWILSTNILTLSLPYAAKLWYIQYYWIKIQQTFHGSLHATGIMFHP